MSELPAIWYVFFGVGGAFVAFVLWVIFFTDPVMDVRLGEDHFKDDKGNYLYLAGGNEKPKRFSKAGE